VALNDRLTTKEPGQSTKIAGVNSAGVPHVSSDVTSR